MAHHHHVCPRWMAYLLASPLRKIWEHPDRILGPHVKEGITAMDVGCALGFFSIPMARLVGPEGKVICVDIQEKLLKSLVKRARKAKVENRISIVLSDSDSLNIADYTNSIDLVLALNVIHETPDPVKSLIDIHSTLKPAAKMILAEPKHFISEADFRETIEMTQKTGFSLDETFKTRSSHGAVLKKK